jgi:hypothetical protein
MPGKHTGRAVLGETPEKQSLTTALSNRTCWAAPTVGK